MPNANSVLDLGCGRYSDITHKTVYTYMSFEQLLNKSGINYEIKHLNIYIYV
ncbi:MAG: hypothetical protein LBC61_06400 [Candidatus Peribacteria bacterium]|nr:hypothetical protein [Candidatus Peribacteria bacterium]